MTAAMMPTIGPATFLPNKPITNTEVHVTTARASRCASTERNPNKSNTDKRPGNKGGCDAVATSLCGCVTNGAAYPLPSARLVAVNRKNTASLASRGNVTAVTNAIRTARPAATASAKIRLNHRAEKVTFVPPIPTSLTAVPLITSKPYAWRYHRGRVSPTPLMSMAVRHVGARSVARVMATGYITVVGHGPRPLRRPTLRPDYDQWIRRAYQLGRLVAASRTELPGPPWITSYQAESALAFAPRAMTLTTE